MCGIAGFVGRGNEAVSQKMIGAVLHRGPDDQGSFVREAFGKTIGLSQARLSILDLSPLGHQPMISDDGSVALVFNGEIYNYKDLKRDLEHKGYAFKGGSDTEVIVKLYQDIGPACFEKMHGMFAIGIYDFKKDELVLARDRMGKKPLFWSIQNSTLMFGSELTALFEHPDFKKELDYASLNKYLFYEYVPTPHTILKHTHKLEPGTYLAYKNGAITKTKFWNPVVPKFESSFEDAVSKLDSLLIENTATRLVADVPVGVFLSGGIDSSAIAYYAQKASKSPIHTFSIGFEEKSFDETKYAEIAAEALQTTHHHKLVTSKEAKDAIPAILKKLDEPMADASIIPTYLLSKFARESVTVAVGGDGGDELFAGYPTFQADKIAGLYKKIPEFVRSGIVEKVINSLPVSHSNFSLEFKLKKFIEAANEGDTTRHAVWLSSFTRSDRQKLLSEKVWNEIGEKNEYEDLEKYASEFDNDDIRNTILYLYERTYMMDGVMVKVDRASMMHALETRSPILDHSIVEFAHSLPYEWKMKGFTGKYLLKELMKDKLPADIVWRTKKGFGIPLGEWLSGDLRDFCDAILSKEKIQKDGIFNAEYVEQLKREHWSGAKNHRKKLWTLIVFQFWKDQFLK